MHPTIHYEIAKARTADMHRQAERDRIARAAKQSGPARSDRSWPAMFGHLAGSLARRILTVPGAHRPRSASRQPAEAPPVTPMTDQPGSVQTAPARP